MRRPNIAITIADDHRHSAMSCATEPVRTPHLDKLAARGTRFTQCRIQGSVVPAVWSPSRAMLHTGRSLFRLPPDMVCGREREALLPGGLSQGDVPLLGQLLRDTGYHTHGVGKWHNERASFARSFDSGGAIFLGGMADHWSIPLHDFDPTGRYEHAEGRNVHSTESFTDAAVGFLESYDGDRPFVLYVAYTAPHDPRDTLPQWHERYRPQDIELPANFMPEHPFDNGELRIRDEELAAFPRTPEETRKHIADYYAMIEHMDDGIGRIHEALARTGHADDTLVIHTADHGLAVGRHGLLGKQNMYEHSLGVPLILAGPDIPRGERRDQPVQMHDLFATLLERAGARPPADTDSVSLNPLIADAAAAGRDALFHAYKFEQRAVRRGDYKLCRYEVGGAVTHQLFNVEADPDELHDLSDDQPDRVAELDAALRSLRAAHGDPTLETPE